MIFDDITNERNRQELLVEKGRIPISLANVDCDDHFAMTVLCEEMGEVARELQHPNKNLQNLKEELVQLAACCVAWCEKIDKQKQNMGFSL